MESWIAYWMGVSQNWVATIIAVAAMAAFKSWNNKKWMDIKMADVKSEYKGLIFLAIFNVLLSAGAAIAFAWVVFRVPMVAPLSKIDVVTLAFFTAMSVNFFNDTVDASLRLYRVFKHTAGGT